MPGGSFKNLRCPHCGGDHLIAHGKRYALYPAGCAYLLNVPVAWLHRASTPHEFECGACGKRFTKRNTAAKIALYGSLALVVGAFLWIFITAFSRPLAAASFCP